MEKYEDTVSSAKLIASFKAALLDIREGKPNDQDCFVGFSRGYDDATSIVKVLRVFSPYHPESQEEEMHAYLSGVLDGISALLGSNVEDWLHSEDARAWCFYFEHRRDKLEVLLAQITWGECLAEIID